MECACLRFPYSEQVVCGQRAGRGLPVKRYFVCLLHRCCILEIRWVGREIVRYFSQNWSYTGLFIAHHATYTFHAVTSMP